MSFRSELVDDLDPIFDDRVFDEKAPDGTPLPFAVFIDDISTTPALRGDARTLAWRTEFQVDVWQAYEDENGEVVEETVDALDGKRLGGKFRLSVVSTHRVPESEDGLVHHAITCSVHRLR